MKKILIFGILSLFITGCVRLDNLSSSGEKSVRDDVFTPAMQLIWNDFKQEMGSDIVFVEGTNKTLENLNSSKFTINDISENSYYKIRGKNDFETKKEIEFNVLKKFNEKSKILDSIPWQQNGHDEVFYSMFKKDVKFPVKYEILDKDDFNDENVSVKYFGLKNNQNKYKTQIKPLFYKKEDCYAISLYTKTSDKIILYRTDSKKDVYALFDEMQANTKGVNKSSYMEFNENDTLKIPFIEFNKTIQYPELLNKEIKNSNTRISNIIDNVQFRLDNEGARLVNEAIMMTENAIMIADEAKNYDFDKPFVLYMIEDGKNNPYFALKISNADYLLKE